MNKRPLSITLVSWLFIVAGSVGLVYHLLPQHIGEFKQQSPIPFELLLICVIRLLAVIAGIFMLRGADWARWLAIAWMAYHVGLSVFHQLSELLVHGLFLLVLLYFLFRRSASMYFSGRRAT